MSEKPIFYQLFNKLTPLPARPSDLKLAHWKPGINLLSALFKPVCPGHPLLSVRQRSHFFFTGEAHGNGLFSSFFNLYEMSREAQVPGALLNISPP
jgi:hypothetical protein